MTTNRQAISQEMKGDASAAKVKSQRAKSNLETEPRGDASEVTPQNNGRRLTIGDSRTVGMACFSGKGIPYSSKVDAKDKEGNRWFAKEGEGLKWMKANIATIKERAQDCDQIVINLGVNDIGNNPTAKAKEYIAYINQLAKEWKAQGKEIIFTSVNPVDDAKCAAPKNKDIETFNRLMKDGLSADVTFADSYSVLRESEKYMRGLDGYGLHSSDSAYVNRVMNDSIQRAQTGEIKQQRPKNQNTPRRGGRNGR